MWYLFVVMLAAAGGASPGWTVLGQLAEGEGYPVSMYLQRGEGTVVVMLEEQMADSFYRHEVFVDFDGSIGGSCSDPYATSMLGPGLFVPAPVSEEDWMAYRIPRGISRLDTVGDTLWTVQLDTVYDDEVGCCTIMPAGSGCYAAFPPGAGSDLWKLYRLDSLGGISMETEFHLQGGPVLGLEDMCLGGDSGVVLTGVTDSLGMNLYMFLLGFDRNGTSTLRVLEDLRFHAHGMLVDTDASGRIYAAGSTGYERQDGYFMPPESTDVFLMEFEPDGRELWRTVFRQRCLTRGG